MLTTRRVSVRGIIHKDGKLFAQKLKKSGKEVNYWCTPGGGLNIGESLLDGLHREMIEETGVAPEIGELLFIQQFDAGGGQEQLEFFFHIKNADDYKIIDLASTSHGGLEISKCGFVDIKMETILPDRLKTVDYNNILSSNQPVQIINKLG